MNKEQLLIGVCFWGKEFRDYFVDLCAPSILADGNLSRNAKRTNDHLLIYTTREDWQLIANHPTVQRLRAMATVEWAEIDFPLTGETKYQHMSKCHLQITERGYEDKKLTVVLSSDAIISKGAFELFLKKSEEGYLTVLAPAIRFSKEGIYTQLIKRNLIMRGAALSLSASELTKMSLGHLHHETETYNYSNNYFSHFPLACYWEVPSGSEAPPILMHTFSWAVLMMDFTSLHIHQKQCLETWTMDGNYVYDNIGDDPNKVYVVRNSSELIYVSLTRDSERIEPSLKNYRKIAGIRAVFHHDIMDPLKQRLFREPVFFGDFSEQKKFEGKIKGQMKVIKNGTEKPNLFDQIYLKYFRGGVKIFLKRSLTWFHNRILEKL